MSDRLTLPFFTNGNAFKIFKALRKHLKDTGDIYKLNDITARRLFNANLESDESGHAIITDTYYKFYRLVRQGPSAVSVAMKTIIGDIFMTGAKFFTHRNEELLIHEEIEVNGVSSVVNITVKDLRFLYEFCYNQAHLRNHYTPEEIGAYVGQQFNPFLIKAIEGLNEKIKAIDDACNSEITKIRNESDKQVREACARAEAAKVEVQKTIDKYIALANNPTPQPVQAEASTETPAN